MRDFATKYRPRKWVEVVGQNSIINVLKSKRDWKALFFQGPPGVGKTTVARLVAMHVNCEGESIDSCGGCKYCRAILSGSVMDYKEENVGDARGIDDMRNIVDWLQYRPVFLKKKVLVLDEVHNLTNAAQNLLLKVVEEPPQYAVIIMCTTSPVGVIEPLKQRCQQFVFRPVGDEDLLKLFFRVVKEEKLELEKVVEEKAVRELLMKSEGSPRKFLTLLEYFVYGGEIDEIWEDERVVRGVVDSVLLGDVVQVIKGFMEASSKVDIRGFIPAVCRKIMERMKRTEEYGEIVKGLAVLRALEEAGRIFGMSEEDRVLYKLLSAAVTVRSISRKLD